MNGLLLLALVGFVSTATIRRDVSLDDPIAQNLEQLSENEKQDFLRYLLALGLTETMRSKPSLAVFQMTADSIATDLRFAGVGNRSVRDDKSLFKANELNITQEAIEKFQAMDIPVTSMMKLVSWTENKFQLNDTGVYQMAMCGEYCDIYGCITIPDISGMCCPW